jgi:uncharacterized protein
MPFGQVLKVLHAPRWEIQEASLAIPHEEVGVETADGRRLSAWWVPSRNRAAVPLMHGSGGSRERVTRHIRMLARQGYGVLALDLPGNGESEGHSNGLGDNAQPAVDAALAWLSRRDGVDPERIAGYGLSLGAEVLIEAAAGDERLRARGRRGHAPGGRRGRARAERRGARGAVADDAGRARRVRHAHGKTTQLYVLPEAAHTGGLRTRPAEYERRTTAFLDRALGL